VDDHTIGRPIDAQNGNIVDLVSSDGVVVVSSRNNIAIVLSSDGPPEPITITSEDLPDPGLPSASSPKTIVAGLFENHAEASDDQTGDEHGSQDSPSDDPRLASEAESTDDGSDALWTQ